MNIFQKIISLLIFVIVISVSILLYVDYFDKSSLEPFSNVSHQLQSVLDYCEEKKTGSDMNLIGLSYYNDTHYIDNNKCQWELLENYPNTNIQCIPGQHHYTDDDVIYVNNTHTFDNGKCIWEETFSWEKQYNKSTTAKLEIGHTTYLAFANGVTEIINSKHEPLKYSNTHPVIDDTYLLKNVEQWNNAWRIELETQHGIYGDEFYTELGRLLIKNEMQYQMNNLGIINTEDDFEVYSGGEMQSLPPHIGYSAVVYATDGHYYWLQGGTHANQVSFYRTSQLQFPDTTEKLSIESLLSNPQLITIIPENGDKSRQEPSTLIVDMNNNTVEFFNNTPEIIRIQDHGSGMIGEESTLAWMGPIILPFQKTTMTFDKLGLIEWDARNAPNLDRPLWWSTHAGGKIIVLSDDMDNFSRDDKARIAQIMLHANNLPIVSSGSGNAEKVLKLGLDPAVVNTVPDAEEYYLQRAHQLIPFDVEIVMYK